MPEIQWLDGRRADVYCLPVISIRKSDQRPNKMKPIEFLIWMRNDVRCIPGSKEGDRRGKPSNGELRRWIKNGCLQVNGKVVKGDDIIEFPITQLVYFPNNNKQRCTVV